ncbi:MAG: hypothetical protein LBF51_06910 [Zoogloeaceae bacterium]|nr:hypothetical protein [Zoogloeaceae bacterium]
MKRVQRRDFKKYCWMANFVMVDDRRLAECNGRSEGLCERRTRDPA